MQSKVDYVIERASKNKTMAEELFSELYIYEHYSMPQLGVDCSTCLPSDHELTWVQNTLMRLNEILNHRCVRVHINKSDLWELLRNRDKLGVRLS